MAANSRRRGLMCGLLLGWWRGRQLPLAVFKNLEEVRRYADIVPGLGDLGPPDGFRAGQQLDLVWLEEVTGDREVVSVDVSDRDRLAILVAIACAVDEIRGGQPERHVELWLGKRGRREAKWRTFDELQPYGPVFGSQN